MQGTQYAASSSAADAVRAPRKPNATELQEPVTKQAKNGTWSFRVWALPGYPSKVARPQRGGFKTEREAKRAGREFVEEMGRVAAGKAPHPTEIPTLAALVEDFLSTYVGDSYTKKCLGWNLKHVSKPIADGGLGEIRVDRLDPRTVERWRARLPEGSAWHVHKALRQLLNKAKRDKLVSDNVAADVKNPRPRVRPGRAKVETLTWAEIDAITDELPPEWRAIPRLAAATGLRPEEWIALEWSDVDLSARVPSIRVERAYSHGELKETKTGGDRRVPLQDEAVRALREHPRRIDTGLVFDSLRPERKPKAKPWIDLTSFRNVWHIALECAGLAECECGHLSGDHDLSNGPKPKRGPTGRARARACEVEGCRCEGFKRSRHSRTPYALRHTYASEALAAGLPTFNLARRMGTSLQMIEDTYGHLVHDSDEWEVALLNTRAAHARVAAAGST